MLSPIHSPPVYMLSRCRTLVLLLGTVGLLAAAPTYGQSSNVKTVEGPRGEKMSVTAQPHQVADGLSVRAMGIADPDTTRWALSLIGSSPEDDIGIRYGDEVLPILSVDRPEDGVGPTKVFISQESFLTIANSSSVTLIVGDETTSLPEQLRIEMQKIFDRTT